jgi:hypothetical protein
VQLSEFIQDLIQQGKVTVAAQLIAFSEEDIQHSITCLQAAHAACAQELTGDVPAFDPGAAVWAARYIYHAVQLALLRDANDATVNDCLTPFPGVVTPAAILSADLCLRYLPNLLALAKGLAPDDILVKRLQETAARWPLSSIGLPVTIDNNDINTILQHNCLRRLYIDRIIETRDAARCNNTLVNEYLKEALGDHSQLLWPGWQPFINE